MNKVFLIFFFLFTGLISSASDIRDVKLFFNKYLNSANNYDKEYFNFYADNAKIIRVVEKDDGTETVVNIPFPRYKSEVKKSQKLMKIRKYKNFYFDVEIEKVGCDYKITAMRMPSTDNYKVPAEFLVGKDKNGFWKIKKECLNTKVQKFLRYS